MDDISHFIVTIKTATTTTTRTAATPVVGVLIGVVSLTHLVLTYLSFIQNIGSWIHRIRENVHDLCCWLWFLFLFGRSTRLVQQQPQLCGIAWKSTEHEKCCLNQRNELLSQEFRIFYRRVNRYMIAMNHSVYGRICLVQTRRIQCEDNSNSDSNSRALTWAVFVLHDWDFRPIEV